MTWATVVGAMGAAWAGVGALLVVMALLNPGTWRGRSWGLKLLALWLLQVGWPMLIADKPGRELLLDVLLRRS